MFREEDSLFGITPDSLKIGRVRLWKTTSSFQSKAWIDRGVFGNRSSYINHGMQMVIKRR